MTEKHAIVQNAAGIHCRPSSIIVNARKRFQARVVVEHSGECCDLDSVMELLCMGLEQGQEIHILASGRDEGEACACLVALFERRFDFPPQGSVTRAGRGAR